MPGRRALRSHAAAVALVAMALLGPPTATRARAEAPAPADSLYRLASTWTRQDGQRLRLGALAGRPLLVAMVYTRCRSTCPLTVAALRRIQRELPVAARDRVGFVLVSFDSDGDQPAVLARFARAQRLDATRWTLLHGGADAVREVAVALGVHYKQIPGGDFAHDGAIVLLDERGVIKARTIDLADATPIVRALTP